MIRVARGGRGFVAGDGRAFVPWGLNYDRSYLEGRDVLLEELLDRDPAKLDRDFERARALGANVIRLFPQLDRYLPGLDSVCERALHSLDAALAAARRHELRVDLTGLTMIDSRARPGWLARASDEEITAAHELFWSTVAARYAGDAGIFCFNLQNEPYVNWRDASVAPTGCARMADGRDYCYLTPHLKDVRGAWARWVRERYPDAAALRAAWPDFPRGRETPQAPYMPRRRQGLGDTRLRDFHRFRVDYAVGWTRRMAAAIRRGDHARLITTGLVPQSAMPVERDAETPVLASFRAQALAPELDFTCIHLYPLMLADDGDSLALNLDWHEMALASLHGLRQPVVVEEWVALGQGVDQGGIGLVQWFDAFTAMSETLARGWCTFYHPLLDDSPGAALGPSFQPWLDRFAARARELGEGGRLPAPRFAAATMELDWMALMCSSAERTRALADYRERRAAAGRPLRVRWRE